MIENTKQNNVCYFLHLSLQFIYSNFRFNLFALLVNFKKYFSKELNDIKKICSKIENLFFDVIQRIPDRFIPQFVMNRIDQYLDKRLNEMQQQVIKYKWEQVELEKTVKNLHIAAEQKKAPSDM